MRTSNRSVSHPCSKRVSATSRTAVYGPVRTVVWEGRSCEAPPYPDPNFEAAEILAPGDDCRLKITTAMDRALCDQLFQLRMTLGYPFRGALSAVTAPSHGLYCECDMGSCEPGQRLIAALCTGGIERRSTDALIHVPKHLCELGNLIGLVGQIIRPQLV